MTPTHLLPEEKRNLSTVPRTMMVDCRPLILTITPRVRKVSLTLHLSLDEDLFDALRTSTTREASNLNFASETAAGYTDDDMQTKIRAQDKKRERYADGDDETTIGIEPGEINLSGGVAENSGRNKKGKKKKDKPVLRW